MKKRRVFGRRRVNLGGIVYWLEMRNDRLVTREVYSRREHVMPLDQIVDVLIRNKLN